MTYSKLGIDGQLVEQIDQQTGKKKFVFTPTVDASGKELPPVPLYKKSRLQGTYIIGATGTGKSGLITNLVLQDIKQGTGVCVLDPHADLTNSILAQLPSDREKDVILLDALDATHVFGLNLYQCDDPTNDELVQETYERVAHIFELLWLDEDQDSTFGPEITEGLLYSTYTLIYNSGTQLSGCGMLEIPILFREDSPRAKMIANIQDPIIRSFWETEYNLFDRDEKKTSSKNDCE